MANLDDIYDVDSRSAAFEKHDHGLLICLAGPGTGKTYSLLNRIEALTGRGCDASALCYVTFIKEIKNAFVGDYKERFGEESYGANAPRISTLHSLAGRVIRNLGFRIGYNGDLFFANISNTKEDSGAIFLNDLLPLVRQDGCSTVVQLCKQLERIKKAWRDRNDATALSQPASAIFGVALKLLRCFRMIDWDQTIPLAEGLLSAPNARPQWMKSIQHYLIDEYQDFNRAEQGFIRLLASGADSAVIVGDDDQSIFSGRGGSPEGLRALYESPEHDHVSLTKCRRCKEKLVGIANAFQSSMTERPRPMIAVYSGGEIICHGFKSSKAEVEFLAAYLKERIDELPAIPKTEDGIVCLFATRRMLSCYYNLLCGHIPCKARNIAVPAKRIWLDRVLQLVARPHQRFLERVLLNDYNELKPQQRRKIINRMLEKDVAPSEACASLVEEGLLNRKASAAGRAFCEKCDAISSCDVDRIASVIGSALGIDNGAVVKQVQKLLNSGEDGGDSEIIASICDSLLTDSRVESEDSRAVLFLTMHGSKGLTKKTVVIPGLEEAWLPGDAVDAALSEQRRLFYVAITRATDNLVLTFPYNRGRKESLNFARPGRGKPCPFVASAGLAFTYHA